MKEETLMHMIRRVLQTAAVFGLSGCVMHVDKPVHVQRGDMTKSIYVVDGAIELDAQARAHKLSTVDGDITLGRWARASGLRSVDGAIAMAAGASCSGDVRSVDGAIRLDAGARVDGNAETLTGSIEARSALIAGHLETVSGRILLHGATHVDQGIVLALPSPKVHGTDQQRLPLVVIGPGVVVGGPIVAHRGGTLWVSRKASIGPVQGITVQWFDGAAPPATD